LHGSPEPLPPYTIEPVFTNLAVRSPLYIAPEPGTDRLFLIDRAPGEPEVWQLRRFLNHPAASTFEVLLSVTNRQLYGLTFHPKYATNGFVYLFHNGPWNQSDRSNRVSRFTIDRQTPWLPQPDSELRIIEWRSAGHDGGDLAFGRDGMLYITSGDGTSDSDGWDSGQDMTRLLAKLLRIDVDHPTPTAPYSVPADNPFLTLAGARPETWAYGFRNPWRMCVDERTGDLWVGQNGQDLWESAHLVRRGDNIGWSVYEGSHPFHAHRRRGPTPIVAPTIEHSHAEFRSLTGGVVYYGDQLPDLNGAYVYGDYATGKIWGARHRDGVLAWHQELADTTLQIASFRRIPPGHLLVVDHAGGIHRLLPRRQERPPPEFPRRLSATGLFSSTPDHQPAPGLLSYSINAPGWMDGARAERFLALPGNARIGYTATRGWHFTNGSAIVQTLWMGPEPTAAAARQRIETRVLLKQDNEWTGYTYRWNEQQTDAVLVGKEGTNVTLELTQESGRRRRQAWRIPSRAECMACHSRAANFVLGLSEAQINRPAADATAAQHSPTNQLLALAHLGVLADAPTSPPESRSRLVNPYDLAAPLDARARSYLHANCSVCHIEAGGGNARMELEITRTNEQLNLISARPQHDTFGITNAMLIAPGDPDRSVLLRRLGHRGRGQMPPLVTAQVDEHAVALFRQWIATLQPEHTFVREWTLSDLLSALEAPATDRPPAAGKTVFHKVGCAQCHRFAGEGGAVGPDLSLVSTRLDRRLLLESILEPSTVIADAYATHEIETADGLVYTGRIVREDTREVVMHTSSAVDELVHVKTASITRRARSPISNMPAGIVNVLELESILDLLAYLASDTPRQSSTRTP
jgi:uncharacterized repeat protein (TIGR03806 family)